MPAAPSALWTVAYSKCWEGRVRRGTERCETTYNEGIVLFFTDAKGVVKVEVPPTRSFPSRVGNFLRWLIGTLAGLKGLLRTFILLVDFA